MADKEFRDFGYAYTRDMALREEIMSRMDGNRILSSMRPSMPAEHEQLIMRLFGNRHVM